jgi:carboxymethylenebutenolidase
MISARLPRLTRFVAVTTAVVLSVAASPPPPLGPLPDRVEFASADGQTDLVGYVFKPEGPHSARSPAVVMMHGRAGPYSSLADGRYDASTLSQRHQRWGHLWAQQGYLAILVDGFGPRGFPQGFTHQSYDQRPESVNEVTVRPFDAYAALAYLRTRDDVAADRIALQGWSNGASAALAAMSSATPALKSATPATGFRGALAFYPGCGLKGNFKAGLLPYAPLRVLVGSADEEISPQQCSDLVTMSQARHGDITIKIYPDATHDFDDPGRRRQEIPANAAATQDATATAIEFLAAVLRR